MNELKEVLKIVVVGHVDHGKSTVIGRLLYDTNSLPEGAVERVKRISKEKGKPFEYAYLLDAFEEEQKQGITIDTTQIQFFTQKRDYVIIDAPGHKEFLKNMISGAANAEAALLVIDAQEGIQEQSKRHGYILSLLGIQKVYVIVNKMDLVDYSETKYQNIKTEMSAFLNNLGVYPLEFIPISAFYGENIASYSEKMPWFKGLPILEAIDTISKDKGLEDKPLRFPIQDVYKFDHRRIIAGRIESGQLKVGDTIAISPGNKTTTIKSIEYWEEKNPKDTAYAGQSVGITVADEFFNKRGEVISHAEELPTVSNSFRANIFWMGRNALTKNKVYKLKIATQEVEATVDKILHVVDATTLSITENVSQVKINDVAEVVLLTKEPIALDLFRDNQNMGRFVLVDGYDVAGGGIVSQVEKAREKTGKFIHEGIEIETQVFDEYFYNVVDYSIKKVSPNLNSYLVGESIPVAGKTYTYPHSYDIIALNLQWVVKIRDAKIESILPLCSYQYENQPLVNARGFALKASSEEEFKHLLQEHQALDKFDTEKVSAFSNKWFEFSQYRQVQFSDERDYDIEYSI